jgi:uncharacterized protein YbbC (DUF1343 family)
MKMIGILALLILVSACGSAEVEAAGNSPDTTRFAVDSIPAEDPLFCNADVRVGAAVTEKYFHLLKDKRVGIVGNQSSLVSSTHLVDTLRSSGINIVRVFSPEHGFRGDADAGEKVKSAVDAKTGLPVVSLYGSNKKPSAEQLADVDVLVFDIQDVGARFYTYISTLHYVMQAAAEQNKKLIVLDRPNPNGHYVDGPVLDPKFSSFVGMHQVPVVHGMTIGEYAQMVNGEGWLGDGLKCDLQVISCEGWDHTKFYELPVPPSPNLRTMNAIYHYPSLCLFEGTVVSLGRGTDHPFEVIGHPKFKNAEADNIFSFVPQPNAAASHPVLQGQTCYGYDLHETDIREYREKRKVDLSYLLEFYNSLDMGAAFFLKSGFINNLAGTDQLKAQIMAGKTLEEIEASWQEKLSAFKQMRKKYLLYEDFK